LQGWFSSLSYKYIRIPSHKLCHVGGKRGQILLQATKLDEGVLAILEPKELHFIEKGLETGSRSWCAAISTEKTNASDRVCNLRPRRQRPRRRAAD
jgi:hypothetical protein